MLQHYWNLTIRLFIVISRTLFEGGLGKTFCRTLAQWLECSPVAQQTWVQSRVESHERLKIPDATLLNAQHYKVRIKVKWSNPGKGVVPSRTPWCGSYRKRSLQVTLDKGRQLYFFTYLPFCREAVDVFYSPSREGIKHLAH